MKRTYTRIATIPFLPRALGFLPQALALLLVAPAAAPAAEVNFDASFHSHYVWRGIVLTDGPVFQPSITAGVGNWSVNTWGNLDLDDANDLSGEFNELDITLNYSVPLEGNMSFDLGLIEYTFPNTPFAGTREVYFSLGWDNVISPVINIYYDFDEVDDFYANVGIGFGSDLSGPGWSWSLSLTAGYVGDDFAAAYTGGIDGGLFEGIANLGLGYERDEFAFGVYVAYLENLDADVLPDQPVDVFGGVNFSWTFN